MAATELIGRSVGEAGPAGPVGFDFRRPSQFAREQVRAIQGSHEVFGRRFATGLGNALSALVQLDPVSVDQVSYDDYIRSMPNPNVLGVVGLPSLAGSCVLDLSVSLALTLVDRLLGGRGGGLRDLRRPTDLETFLLRDLMGHGVAAIGETLSELLDGRPELTGVEYNPQLVQVAAPSDMVMLLTYRMTVTQGLHAEGLLTLCYPTKTLVPLLDALNGQSWDVPAAEDDAAQEAARAVVQGLVEHVPVTLTACVGPVDVPAADLVALRAGDVLRLDHRVTQPFRACVEGLEVLEGHVGRRGRRLALQVTRWLDRADARTLACPRTDWKEPRMTDRTDLRGAGAPPAPSAEVAPAAYPDLGPGIAPGPVSDLDLLADVDLTVTVELGRVRLKVRDLLRLAEGSVVELDRAAGAPVDVLVNGSLVARGDVVVVDDELGVRVTELLKRP